MLSAFLHYTGQPETAFDILQKLWVDLGMQDHYREETKAPDKFKADLIKAISDNFPELVQRIGQ